MKKLVAILLSAVLLIGLLTACGEKKPAPSDPVPVPADLDLNVVYQQIVALQKDVGEELVLFSKNNPDLIENFYPGMKDFKVKQQVLYMHPVTGAPSEIFLVEAENAADAEAIAKIMKARADSGADDRDYPENAKVWKERSTVQVSGNYVGLVCFFEPFIVPENIFALPALPAEPAEPSEPSEPAEPAVPESLDLNDVYQGILDLQKDISEKLFLFGESNPDLIESFYPGFKNYTVKQQALYMHPVTGAPSEVFLVEAENAADAEAIAKIMQARVDSASNDTIYPENAKTWKERATVQVSGNYAGLVCFFEPFIIPDAIFAVK